MKGVKKLEDEKKLIQKSKSGDLNSFETLIKTYQKMAYNVAYRIMGNEEDAKDMTQEALIKVYRNIGNFRMDSSFSTWLYRIVMNTCKDELRKRKVKVISIDQPIETGDGQMQMEIEDEGRKPDEILVSKETQNEVHEALQEVSEKNRIVVVLRDIKGFSYSEISDIIDVPVGTIKSRISRGRQELKNVLLNKRQRTIREIL
jgi:RNA polymerase sigma-70 factor (ECF subfamily)